MKKVGIATRLLVVIAVLSLAAFTVAGCGSDKNDSGSTATSGSGGGAAGGTKQYDSGQTVGSSKKVVVDSDASFSAEQQAVVDRIGEFADATATQNYKKLCNDILSKSAQKIGGNCVETFSKSGAALKDFKITVKSVKIGSDGKSATATIDVSSNVNKAQQSQTLSLVKENGDWRVEIIPQ
jgi:hypothetical protein